MADKTDKTSTSRSSSLSESIQRAWNDALAATVAVEDDLKRKLGQLLARTGLQQGSEELGRLASDLSRRLQRNREEIERAFDDAVRAAATKVRDPLVEEIAALRGRAEKLAQRIERQVRGTKDASAPASGGDDRSGADPSGGNSTP
jgi:DNA anti-recombination protein RmuC